MKFQLVVQIEELSAPPSLDLIDMSEEVRKRLPSSAILDGHDFGLGEFNIFIHTDRPVEIFSWVMVILTDLCPGLSYTAGFRAFTDEEYTPIHPKGLAHFGVA